MKFFKNLFKTSDSKARNKKRYDHEKKTIEGDNLQKRRKIASSPSSHPEILFYLTGDSDLETRKGVAQNVATPIQASEVIAKDKNEDVRILLAQRLVKMLPDLAEDMHGQLYAHTIKTLTLLARDEVAKIRIALSSALRDHAFAPPDVIKQLAYDVERAVSEPLLQHCAKLSEEDLLEILRSHPEPWAQEAIAKRKVLNAEATKYLIENLDEASGLALLNNDKIKIEGESFASIVAMSEHYIAWQEPVALRQELTYALAQNLVGFCEDVILNVLLERDDFDPEMAQDISDMVGRRVAFVSSDLSLETLEQKVNRFAFEGRLDGATILDALAWKEEGFVKLALSRLSGVHHLIVEKIFASQSPKSITALSWHCKLPMRVAVALQKTIGSVPSSSLIYAKSGVGYPLAEADMIWQLEFFGVTINIEKAIEEQSPDSIEETAQEARKRN